MPPSARISDFHICPRTHPGPRPHVGGPIAGGASTVLIAGMPAARLGDRAVCSGASDRIAKGSSSVIIGNKPAARMGDKTAHKGVVVEGVASVLIGG